MFYQSISLRNLIAKLFLRQKTTLFYHVGCELNVYLI